MSLCISVVTTDSTASEEDNVPPPLPAKTRESSDYSNLPSLDSPSSLNCHHSFDTRISINRSVSMISGHSGRYTNKPLPAIPTESTVIVSAINSSYDLVETRMRPLNDSRMRPRPPTPPPKPSRNSKTVHSAPDFEV